ncbi:glycosyltransferase [Prochlorococcus sp. AH-716-B03]|nr:glycosyltransferase [Prochlorococcus sp. AH-716-B03]
MSSSLSKFSDERIGSEENNPTLSIIIPCFNEINTISQVIKAVKVSSIKSKEIIIIDDGSTDGSREYLQNKNDKDLKIIFHKNNKGKGAAINSGVKHATSNSYAA